MEDSGATDDRRALQVRLVLAVYRAELSRARDDEPPDQAARRLSRIRVESLRILDDLHARLEEGDDGLSEALSAARREIAAAGDAPRQGRSRLA